MSAYIPLLVLKYGEAALSQTFTFIMQSQLNLNQIVTASLFLVLWIASIISIIITRYFPLM